MPQKKQIPKAVRISSWDVYIGPDVRIGKCFCCNLEQISITNFSCGHILAESNGGRATIDNLVPVCIACNTDMASMHMYEFMKQHGMLGLKNFTADGKPITVGMKSSVAGLLGVAELLPADSSVTQAIPLPKQVAVPSTAVISTRPTNDPKTEAVPTRVTQATSTTTIKKIPRIYQTTNHLRSLRLARVMPKVTPSDFSLLFGCDDLSKPQLIQICLANDIISHGSCAKMMARLGTYASSKKIEEYYQMIKMTGTQKRFFIVCEGDISERCPNCPLDEEIGFTLQCDGCRSKNYHSYTTNKILSVGDGSVDSKVTSPVNKVRITHACKCGKSDTVTIYKNAFLVDCSISQSLQRPSCQTDP